MHAKIVLQVNDFHGSLSKNCLEIAFFVFSLATVELEGRNRDIEFFCLLATVEPKGKNRDIEFFVC